MKQVAPSFLSADIWQVSRQVQALEEAGCRFLHLDIMDGHFVPNISFGPGWVKWLRPHSDMVFDAHLMVEEPDFLLESAQGSPGPFVDDWRGWGGEGQWGPGGVAPRRSKFFPSPVGLFPEVSCGGQWGSKPSRLPPLPGLGPRKAVTG